MTAGNRGASGAPDDPPDQELLTALQAGDEAAFMLVVERYHAALVRLAGVYVHDRGVAEEVAQETWLGVLRGLGRFEGRSALKTWLFHILVNRARSRAAREGRSVPFSDVWDPAGGPVEPSVEPERFQDASGEQGHWISMPRDWRTLPEDHMLSDETCRVIRTAIEALPPMQREVIALRDVEQCSAGDVCIVLGVSEINQRVLLHRARSKVRRVLEQYFGE